MLFLIKFEGKYTYMNVKEATARRIEDLCKQNLIAYNNLAVLCGVTPSTIYSILDSQKNKTVTITTIKKICDGLEITLKDFFDSPLFENLEPEIY